jgi:hypothetical protein
MSACYDRPSAMLGPFMSFFFFFLNFGFCLVLREKLTKNTYFFTFDMILKYHYIFYLNFTKLFWQLLCICLKIIVQENSIHIFYYS